MNFIKAKTLCFERHYRVKKNKNNSQKGRKYLRIIYMIRVQDPK